MAGQALADDAAQWSRELARGSNRLVLLALLRDGESYGYEILASLKQRGITAVPATEAAVYPLLKDLEERSYLKGRWKATEDGVPPRKYYAVTPEGKQMLATLKKSWTRYRDEMDAILEAE